MTDLTGKTIILTGAAGGMGTVMALALAEAGATVAAVDRDAPRHGAPNIKPYQTDLADLAAAEALIPQIHADLGPIFGLINLAGVGHAVFDPDFALNPPRFWECDIPAWQTLMNINVRAPWILAGAAVRHMLPRGSGRIVNITTSFDTMLQPKNAAYGQSKAALEAATAAWARELDGTGITVNALAPGGPTNTGLIPQNSPMPRDQMIQPEVMAKPIIWLMSDKSNLFTNRRIIARLWDETTADQSPPAAWPNFGTQSKRP